MSNIKYKPQAQLSGWMEYPLLGDRRDDQGKLLPSDKLDPPIFRCRLRPVDEFNMIDGFLEGGKIKPKMGRATVEVVMEAVAEWDLEENGTPIPCTSENKALYLRPIIADLVEGRNTLLGIAIVQDAQNRESFLKN